MRTINPSSFLSLLKPTTKAGLGFSSPSSPTTPISSSSSASDLQPPSPTSSTGSSSSDFENDTPPVSPVRATTLVVPVAPAPLITSRPPLRRRFGLVASSQPTPNSTSDGANSGDEEDEADGPGRVVSFLGHATGGHGPDKDGRMNSFGSVGSCGGNGASTKRTGPPPRSRRGSFNPPQSQSAVQTPSIHQAPASHLLSPSIGTTSPAAFPLPLTLDFSTLPAFVAPAPNNSPVSPTGASSDALGLVWSNHAASITSITIDHFTSGGSGSFGSIHASAAAGGRTSRVSTPGVGIGHPSTIQRKRPSICFSLTFDEDATLIEAPSPPATPDRSALFSPLAMDASAPLAPRLLPSLSQTLIEGLLLLPPSPLDLPTPMHHHHQLTTFALPPNPPPTPLSGPPASPRPPTTRSFVSPPPELPLTPPLSVSRSINRRRSSVFKVKTDCPTPPSLLDSPRMGWRREYQAGWGTGTGLTATPASTPTGYRRAEGGGKREETKRVWGEFWGMKVEEMKDDKAGTKRDTPIIGGFAAEELVDKLERLANVEGSERQQVAFVMGGGGAPENPYFVGALVA